MAERGSRFLKMEGRPRDGIPLGLGFFLCSPAHFSAPFPLPLLLVFHCSMVFIGKVLLGFQTSPSTFPFLFFSFFFCKFWFLLFFVVLKASNININSIRKISNHKIYMLKVERVLNTLKNLNSFEMTLKMLKTMQIYQKYIFWGFHCFFGIFCKFIKNMGKKLGSDTNKKNKNILNILKIFLKNKNKNKNKNTNTNTQPSTPNPVFL